MLNLFNNTSKTGKVQFVNYNQVLASNFIVTAWVSHSGIRYVCIENISVFNVDNYRNNTTKSFTGNGANIEDAFKRALLSLRIDSTQNKKISRRLTSSKKKSTIISKFDDWMAKNQGTLRAFKDDDGTIVCTLSGLKNPELSHVEKINVYGVGINFKTALTKAIRIMDGLHYSTKPVQYIKIY